MKIRRLVAHIAGERVLKTGIAVLITAAICRALQIQAIFAVITAIVSIEPTTADSIKKGLIRLPASAIGAAIAISLVVLLQYAALTYALATVLTIIICTKLKLHDGVLVATVTAVAMIPNIKDPFVVSFLIRLGTTLLGLVVATLVNLFILPPKFSPFVAIRVQHLFHVCAEVLEMSVPRILKGRVPRIPASMKRYAVLRNEEQRIMQLLMYQREEWRFHKASMQEYRFFIGMQRQLVLLQRIILHLEYLQYINRSITFSDEEETVLTALCRSMAGALRDASHAIDQEHMQFVKRLEALFKTSVEKGPECQEYKQYWHHFSVKAILYYELLALHDTLEELQHIFSKKVTTPK